MKVDMRARAYQVTPNTTGEGDLGEPSMSKIGSLFTADWLSQLLFAGLIYHFDVGTIAAGAEPSPVVGGGNGTVIDTDQPEFGIGVPTGYCLIPLVVKITGEVDMDADGEMGEAIVWLDLAATLQTDGTATTTTPQNKLDGGAAFPGTCRVAFTADMTDSTISEILDYEHIQGSDNGTAGNLVSNRLKLHYEPRVPGIYRGPCCLYGAWGGTAAVNGIAYVEVACVPISYFPLE